MFIYNFDFVKENLTPKYLLVLFGQPFPVELALAFDIASLLFGQKHENPIDEMPKKEFF